MWKYVLELTEEKRSELRRLVDHGHEPGWKIRRAQCLLACDQSAAGPAWPDERVARAYGCSVRSVEYWRKLAVEKGPDAVLRREPHPQPMRRHTLTGEDEARLAAIACSSPPQGRGRWSLSLLSRTLVELKVVDRISKETVRLALKKTNCNPGAK